MSTKKKLDKIGFGGGCHWCTEAVFQSLKGVEKVDQGWIASSHPNDEFSEAVVVHYDKSMISLSVLITIHMYTHSCTSDHPMRRKYRSAVYTFDKTEVQQVEMIIEELQIEFGNQIITQILPFVAFRQNVEKYQNYYQKNRDNQFCNTYISPKLQLLMREFAEYTDSVSVKNQKKRKK